MKPKISEFTYVELSLGAFVFAPEIRRLVDWRSHFAAVEVLSIVPLLMLLPIGVMAFRRRGLITTRPFYSVAWIWILAFAYAVFIGLVHKSLLPGLYGVGLFVLPIVIAAWLLGRPEDTEYCFKRLSRTLLIYAGLAGFYGVVQYALAPPWDSAWISRSLPQVLGSLSAFKYACSVS